MRNNRPQKFAIERIELLKHAISKHHAASGIGRLYTSSTVEDQELFLQFFHPRES